MKKLLAGSGVAVVAALGVWGASAPAQAYPNDNPTGGTTPSSDVLGSNGADSATASAAGSGVLPNTGGPETALLLGGGALLAAGGAVVVATKRRRTTS